MGGFGARTERSRMYIQHSYPKLSKINLNIKQKLK